MIFELSKEQTTKFNEWVSSKPFKYDGAIGGRFGFKFIPTGIGTVVKAYDSMSDTLEDAELDLTDYENW